MIRGEWKRKKRSEEKTFRESKDRLRGGGREDYLRDWKKLTEEKHGKR